VQIIALVTMNTLKHVFKAQVPELTLFYRNSLDIGAKIDENTKGFEVFPRENHSKGDFLYC